MSKGTAGKVDFPEHMKDVHIDWLGHPTSIDVTLDDVMNTALGAGGNPFESLSYTDPETDFDEVETSFGLFNTDVQALDHATDYGSIVDAIVAKLDTSGILNDVDVTSYQTNAEAGATSALQEAISQAVSLVDSDVIMRLVKSFEARTSYSRDRAVTRFSNQMADINAVQGSAYMFGLALIEAQVMQSVEDFHSEVTREQFNANTATYVQLFRDHLSLSVESAIRSKVNRDQLLGSNMQLVFNALYNNTNLKQSVASTLAEIKRLRTVAESEYVGNTADLNRSFSSWDFNVFNMATPVLGGMGGGTALPPAASKTSSAIGGAIAGATAGAAFGPAGAGVGAALGGLSAFL